MAKKTKQLTDLEKMKNTFNELGQSFKEYKDEYDFTELVLENDEHYVEFYFNETGKYSGITKAYFK